MPPGKVISEAHARLGRALRATRTAAGISTRSVRKTPIEDPGEPRVSGSPYYSSGHISLVETGATAPSPELIDAYAAMPGGAGAELRSLYAQMQTATREAGRRRRQGSEPGSVPAAPRSMQDVSDRHDVQQHYVVVSTAADYRFGPTGAVDEVVVSVTLRAKSSGVLLYYTGFSYPADQRAGVLQVEALTGAAVLSTQESPSGALSCYFRLDRELAPDDPDPHTITFRLAVRSEARAVPCLAYFASGGSEQLSLRAEFASPAPPGSFWWFAVPDLVDAEHPVPGQDVRGPAGIYERRFEPLVPGWCYGFAWTW